MQVSVYRYDPDQDEAPEMRDMQVDLPADRDLMVLDVLELLKAQAPGASYPVILLTSHADEAMQAEAMAAGAAQYVVKSEVTLLEMPQPVDDVFREAGSDA